MNKKTVLSVNLNKIALIRNARGRNYPDLAYFARQCLQYGAGGVTIHPRPDQRYARSRRREQRARNGASRGQSDDIHCCSLQPAPMCLGPFYEGGDRKDLVIASGAASLRQR